MRIRHIACTSFICLLVLSPIFAQTEDRDRISIRTSLAGGTVYFLDCVDGFGGGNVAASVGEDGVLLVDDMFVWMTPKLEASLKSLSDKPVHMVLNTHFHRDHIEGNTAWRKTSFIVAHENVAKQLIRNNKEQSPTTEMMPTITYSDRFSIKFNGEEIQAIHFPNSHTDGDAMIYFPKSKVIHLGDMFFFGMFPAVYTQGGGDIRQLILSLETILKEIPPDVKVIPGHGELATMKDLSAYVFMLKETTSIVEAAIRQGKSLEQLKEAKSLAAYDALGNGGAQTTDQYLAMLFKLLSPEKK